MGLERFERLKGFALGQAPYSQLTERSGLGAWPCRASAHLYLRRMVLVVGFLLAYAISYFFSAQTMIYLLLRKKVDGIEMNEIFEEKGEEEPLFPLKAESTAQKAPKPADKPAVVPLNVVPSGGAAPDDAAKSGEASKT